jgi:hypothetical protein
MHKVFFFVTFVLAALYARGVHAQDEATAPAGENAVAPAPEPAVEMVPVPTRPQGGDQGFGKPDSTGDGTRVVVKEGDFSLVPPKGWEVFTRLDNLTLLMQVPKQPGLKYQRTIQVASFSEPCFIDELTAKEYENVIVQKFSSISSAIEDYRIRNHMTVDMADGRSALLFYTEFKLEGVNLMQAHILVSSATRHYLMTFTDVAEHFESDDANQFLAEAWDAMISVQLATRTPQRFQTFVAVGVGVLVLAVLALVVIGVRSWRSGRSYRQYADGRDLPDDEVSTAPTSIQMESGAPTTGTSDVSGISNVKTFKKKPVAEAEPKSEVDQDPMTNEDIAI